jgi:hypothetical protein
MKLFDFCVCVFFNSPCYETPKNTTKNQVKIKTKIKIKEVNTFFSRGICTSFLSFFFFSAPLQTIAPNQARFTVSLSPLVFSPRMTMKMMQVGTFFGAAAYARRFRHFFLLSAPCKGSHERNQARFRIPHLIFVPAYAPSQATESQAISAWNSGTPDCRSPPPPPRGASPLQAIGLKSYSWPRGDVVPSA